MNPSTLPTRNELLAQIHVAARDLGLETRKGSDRTAYEAILGFLIGKDSCKDASREQLEFVADTLARRAAGCKLEAIVFTPVPVQRIVVMSREQYEREERELERMLAGVLMGFTLQAPDGAIELVYGALVPLPAPLPAPAPQLEPLPPLVEIECPTCRGVGYLEFHDPIADSQRCPECFGRERIEVCSGCREVPRVEKGLEVCGCSVSLI